jgi:hypothetical protein
VVTGVQNDQGPAVAALWWSADLATWVTQGLWTGAVPDGDSSALLAVAAGPDRFRGRCALGTHPAVGSPDGQERRMSHWRCRPGRQRRAQRVGPGACITALGVQARSSGLCRSALSRSTVAALAGDLAARPGGSALVTALVTVGKGFLATGTWCAAGPGCHRLWSRNGIAWHAVRPAGTWRSVPGAQLITGLSASGTMLTGVGYTATGTGRHSRSVAGPVR